MIVLVSLSRVLADVEREFCRLWECMYRLRPKVPMEQRRSPNLVDDYPKMYREDVKSILSARGFFRHLMPVAGAVEALHEMTTNGLDVRICTSSLPDSLFFAQEKIGWVRQYLGESWAGRMILTPDKAIVRGDLLITAIPPRIESMEPTWRPIIFDQPFNQGLAGPRLYSWADWRAAVTAIDVAHI